MTRRRSPSGAPASASMRASWPPPSIPTVVTSAPDRDARVVVAGDLVALALAERGQRFGDLRVVDGQQRRGEQRGTRRARVDDGERRDRDARWPLYGRQKRNIAVERPRERKRSGEGNGGDERG